MKGVVRQAGRVYVGEADETFDGSGQFWFRGQQQGGSEVLEGKFSFRKIAILEEKKREERKE